MYTVIRILGVVFLVLTLFALIVLWRISRRPLITFDDLEAFPDEDEGEQFQVVPRLDYRLSKTGTGTQVFTFNKSVIYTATARGDGKLVETLDVLIRGKKGMLITFVADEIETVTRVAGDEREVGPRSVTAREYNQALGFLCWVRKKVGKS
jgi:hypothetical protein